MEIDFIKMTLSLTTEKVQKIIKTFSGEKEPSQESFYNSSRLTLVVGLLSSTMQAVQPAKIQLRFLQQQQIVRPREKKNHQSVITLNIESIAELTWWVESLRFCNDQTFSHLDPQIIIQTAASLTGWVTVWVTVCNIRAMVRGRENLIHKYVGTTSNKIGSVFLHQSEKNENHTLPDRQQGSLVLPFQNGENEE